jgi:hypothetical protein
MDVSDVRNLQNVEETVVHTPPKCEFDSSLLLRLTIRKDGTAIPQFVYQTATPSHQERLKEGRKFTIDMTEAAGGGGEAYLGLDFGTSNTAMSYVDKSWVQVIETRSTSSGWKELGELVDVLPGPLAVPLARYIRDQGQGSVVPPGHSFIEVALCFAAYVSYIEFCCSQRRATTKIFRQFPHRSATGCWTMLKTVQEQLGKSATVTATLKGLFTANNSTLLDRITRNWAQTRHELGQADRDDVLSAVKLLANACHAVFSKHLFGYMESVQKGRFSATYSGRFRIAHGKPPYTSFLTYMGDRPFSEAEALMIDPSTGGGLLLTPLVLWYPCKTHIDSDNGHCFVFDKLKEDHSTAIATYKAASFPCQTDTEANVDMGAVLGLLTALRNEDQRLPSLSGLALSKSGGSVEMIIASA